MKLSPKKIGGLLTTVAIAHGDSQKEGVHFLAKLIMKAGKTSKLGSIVSAFKKDYNRKTDTVDVTVTATSEHSIPHIKELQGKKVSLRKIIDPTILGGVKIQTEDFLIDNTVLNKINQLKNV